MGKTQNAINGTYHTNQETEKNNNHRQPHVKEDGQDFRMDHHSSDRIFGLSRDQIAPQFREPFILTGYRRPNMRASDCIKSVFLPGCNECMNVWSHFIAFILFVLKFYNIYSTEYSIMDPFTWPLLSFAMGICGFCLMSSTAHMFNSMSVNVRHSCFFMDYAAISVYSVGAGQAFYFYSRPLDPSIFPLQSVNVFLITSLLVSFSSTLLCCLSRHRWHKAKYIIRTASYFTPFSVNAFPYLYRMFHCTSDIDCTITKSLPIFKLHCFFYILSAVANMVRFPERIFPGKFDLLGHSHHFLHVFTALGAAYQFDAIQMDMITRMEYLKQEPIKITFWNSLAIMLIGIVMNFGIAVLFGVWNSRRSTEIKLENKKEN